MILSETGLYILLCDIKFIRSGVAFLHNGAKVPLKYKDVHTKEYLIAEKQLTIN